MFEGIVIPSQTFTGVVTYIAHQEQVDIMEEVWYLIDWKDGRSAAIYPDCGVAAVEFSQAF